LSGRKDINAMKTIHEETLRLLLNNGWPMQLIDLITPAVDSQGDEAREWFRVLFGGTLPAAIVSAGPGSAEPGAPKKKPGEKKEAEEKKDRFTLDTLPADMWVEGTKVDGLAEDDQKLRYRKILDERCRTDGTKLEMKVKGIWEDMAAALKVTDDVDARMLRNALIKGSVGEWVAGIDGNERYQYRVTKDGAFESKGKSAYKVDALWKYEKGAWQSTMKVPTGDDVLQTMDLAYKNNEWQKKGEREYMTGADSRIYTRKGDTILMLNVEGAKVEWIDPLTGAGIAKGKYPEGEKMYVTLLRDGKIGEWVAKDWQGKGGYEFKIDAENRSLLCRKQGEKMAQQFTGEGPIEGWTQFSIPVFETARIA
ncbi:hypothetical protein HYT95_02040, partial [Candidatus Peregrinibacteria bacterium]|nr:hypothetical protein [Candidatus Peregrinibacteria bacterium]